MPINPTQQSQYQAAPVQPSHPGYAPQQPVWGQPIAYGGGVAPQQHQQPHPYYQPPQYQPQPQHPMAPNHHYGGGPQFDPFAPVPPQQQQQQQPYQYHQQQQQNYSPIPPPPEKQQQQQQQQQQVYGHSAAAPPLLNAYPSMPENASAPVTETSRINAAAGGNGDWQSAVLAFQRGPNGAPVGFPAVPDPTLDPRWKVQEGDTEDDILENRICRGIKLRDCELRNCYVVDCTVKDSLIKGGYYSTSKLKECEFQNTLCIISCTVTDSIAKWSGLTNVQIKEGDLQKCNTLDAKVVDSNVWGGTAVRCDFRKCGIQHTLQDNCRVSESSTSAKQVVP